MVFTESYTDGSVLDGINPIPNLGTSPAYPIDGSEKEFVVYLQRFNLLLIGYAISGNTLVWIIRYYFKEGLVGILRWVLFKCRVLLTE